MKVLLSFYLVPVLSCILGCHCWDTGGLACTRILEPGQDGSCECNTDILLMAVDAPPCGH